MYQDFGNALIGAVYVGPPTWVSPYSVYAADIGRLGFDLIEMGDQVTDEAVEATRRLLSDPRRRELM